MLIEEQLDILSVCTWNGTHLAIVASAVDASVKAIAESLTSADDSGPRVHFALCSSPVIIESR